MIETLRIQNLKVLRDVDVRLRPLTVIVGPNASGKSTILKALAAIIEYDGTLATLARILPGGRIDRVFEIRSQKNTSNRTILQCTGDDLNGRFQAGLVFESGGVIPQIVGRDFVPILRPLMLGLEVEKLAEISYPRTGTLSLPEDGYGLSSVLASLHVQDLDRFKSIVERLKRIVPGVRDVRLRLVSMSSERGEPIGGYEIIFDMAGAGVNGIPADSVSDGTLLTLGLLTILALPAAPQLVLIDDLERGLHPKALRDLVLQLRRIQEQQPELQIVATSHSPYLLDFLEADEILLTSLDEDGYAMVKPLTDHPEYERWKDVMAPGEFWSTVGESWITKKDSEQAPTP